MATRVEPLLPTARALLEVIYQQPRDLSRRLVLADYLEEQGDPRASLVRLLPHLLALPQRAGLRPDLPCRAFQEPNRDEKRLVWHTTRKDWPQIKKPIPPVGLCTTYTMPRAPYRGYHNLGRLFCLVIDHESLRFQRERRRYPPHIAAADLGRNWLEVTEPRFWAYYCRLTDPKERDATGCWRGDSNHRTFGHYIHVLEASVDWCRRSSLSLHTHDTDRAHQEAVEDRLRSRAEVYGRFLDLHDEFVRICPWQAAHEAWQRARVPPLTVEQRREHRRRNQEYWQLWP